MRSKYTASLIWKWHINPASAGWQSRQFYKHVHSANKCSWGNMPAPSNHGGSRQVLPRSVAEVVVNQCLSIIGLYRLREMRTQSFPAAWLLKLVKRCFRPIMRLELSTHHVLSQLPIPSQHTMCLTVRLKVMLALAYLPAIPRWQEEKCYQSRPDKQQG